MESISMLLNVTGPSGPLPTSPHLRSMANCLCVQECVWAFSTSPVTVGRSSRSLRIHLESECGFASGPFEFHLPDTARLRRPLRTTQETGPGWGGRGGGDPSHPKNPRLTQLSAKWTKLVESITPARKTSDTEHGEQPPERHNEEKVAVKHPKRAARTTAKKKDKQKQREETSRD